MTGAGIGEGADGEQFDLSGGMVRVEQDENDQGDGKQNFSRRQSSSLELLRDRAMIREGVVQAG